MRALGHRLLLRGLRPARVAHAPPLSAQAAARLRAFEVVGARGQRLAAWLALPEPPTAAGAAGAPVVVAVHGWGANASALWPLVEPLNRAGLAVLLFDAANHGRSSAEDFSSLPRFAEDLAAVLCALPAQPDVDAARVALVGHSVGGAAVLLHAATRGGVRAVVSLAAFAHPREVMLRWLHTHRIPRRWPGEAILAHVQTTIGERFDRIAPEALIPRVDCPVLLVHGEHDTTVPVADAQRLHARARRAELWVLPGDHDLRAALQPRADRMVGFLQSALRGDEPR